MAENQTPAFTHNVPTRTIAVNGERTASMVRSTIRVSQIESRILHMSMAGSSQMASAVNRASEDFQRAYATFEASLKAIASDLEITSRRGGRRRGGSSETGAPRPAGNANAPQQSKAQKGGPKATKTTETKPKQETLKAKPAKPKQVNSDSPALAAAPAVENKAPEAKVDPIPTPQVEAVSSVVPDTLKSL